MIDRQQAKRISADLEAALRPVASKYGLELEVRGGTYDGTSYRPKIAFKTSDADASEFAMYADVYGLEASDFGATFPSQGRTFKITGVAPRSPKRPILCEELATGRTFKFTDSYVRSALGRSH